MFSFDRIFTVTSSFMFLIALSSSSTWAQTGVKEIDVLWQMAQQDDNAVSRFIADRKGDPLVNNVEGQPFERDVTFYMVAEDETDYVLYSGGPDFGGLVMQKLGDSNFRFVTLRLAHDARFRYNFTQYQQKSATTKDPSLYQVFSRSDERILELEHAPKQSYIAKRPNVKSGKLDSFSLNSAALSEKREIQVYTPPIYDDKIRHKLLIVLDGEDYSAPANAGPRSRAWVPTPTILDNLQSDAKIPPTIAVFVSSMRKRRFDMPTDAFGDFIANELMDWARENYAISNDPQDTILAGSSRGGYAAALTAYRYPEKVGNVLSLSGGFGINDKTVSDEVNRVPFHFSRLRYYRGEGKVPSLYKNSEKLPIRFYLTIGVYDLDTMMVATNRQFKDILEIKNYDVDYIEFSGGHDYLSWRGQLADGLIALANG